MEDNQIILLLKEKPQEGLREAVEKYRGAVQAVVGRILPYNPQDAEECVSDTFVHLWKTIDRVEADTKTLKGLILCMARNLAINRYRQLKRGQVVSLETLELTGEEDVPATVLGAEATRQLQKLILELEEPDKEIFFRKYFLFETLREIGSKVGLDEIQVRNRLYRGRLKLRRQLEERGISNEAI